VYVYSASGAGFVLFFFGCFGSFFCGGGCVFFCCGLVKEEKERKRSIEYSFLPFFHFERKDEVEGLPTRASAGRRRGLGHADLHARLSKGKEEAGYLGDQFLQLVPKKGARLSMTC